MCAKGDDGQDALVPKAGRDAHGFRCRGTGTALFGVRDIMALYHRFALVDRFSEEVLMLGAILAADNLNPTQATEGTSQPKVRTETLPDFPVEGFERRV